MDERRGLCSRLGTWEKVVTTNRRSDNAPVLASLLMIIVQLPTMCSGVLSQTTVTLKQITIFMIKKEDGGLDNGDGSPSGISIYKAAPAML